MVIEFIIPTYNRYYPLHCLLSSLLTQTSPNWRAIVVIDDEKLWDNLPIQDDKIKYICTGKRYNDWGHTPREIGKQQSTADYIIMTGDDNYYVPTFVEEVLKISSSLPGIIYWNMVHNYFQYSAFYCRLQTWQIDMGAFALRNDIAKQLHLITSKIDADGELIEEYKKKFPNEKSIKIEKILYVHN